MDQNGRSRILEPYSRKNELPVQIDVAVLAVLPRITKPGLESRLLKGLVL